MNRSANLSQISTRWPLVSDPVQFALRYAEPIQHYLAFLVRRESMDRRRLRYELLEDRQLLSVVTQWSNHDAGGQGAFFSPSFSPWNSNELYFSSDMSGLFHSTDQGNSWTRADFRQIVTGAYGDSVQFTSDPSILYAIDFSAINGMRSTWRPPIGIRKTPRLTRARPTTPAG